MSMSFVTLPLATSWIATWLPFSSRKPHVVPSIGAAAVPNVPKSLPPTFAIFFPFSEYSAPRAAGDPHVLALR